MLACLQSSRENLLIPANHKLGGSKPDSEAVNDIVV